MFPAQYRIFRLTGCFHPYPKQHAQVHEVHHNFFFDSFRSRVQYGAHVVNCWCPTAYTWMHHDFSHAEAHEWLSKLFPFGQHCCSQIPSLPMVKSLTNSPEIFSLDINHDFFSMKLRNPPAVVQVWAGISGTSWLTSEANRTIGGMGVQKWSQPDYLPSIGQSHPCNADHSFCFHSVQRVRWRSFIFLDPGLHQSHFMMEPLIHHIQVLPVPSILFLFSFLC